MFYTCDPTYGFARDKNQDIFALTLKLSSNMQKLRELIKKWGGLVLLPTVVTLCVILLAIFFILASSKRTTLQVYFQKNKMESGNL